ncbi:MAG: hypothetical protein ABUK17_11115, partial [Syntrophobacteria bacterium]
LTSSEDSTDINRAYDLGINSYLLKPVKFNDLAEMIRTVDLYWLIHNISPKVKDVKKRSAFPLRNGPRPC